MDLPPAPPFIAPVDVEHVAAYQRINSVSGSPDHSLRLDLTPAPWNGDPRNADVVILLQNPGVDEGDLEVEEMNGYREACREMLRFDMSDPTWPYLRPEFSEVPGGRWWHSRLAALSDLVGGDYAALCSQVAAVQLHGYHSVKWRSFGVTIPSQEFNFALVRKAIARGALVICTRGAQIWTIAVPELVGYGNLFKTRNVRAAYISKNNLEAGGWQALVDRLT